MSTVLAPAATKKFAVSEIYGPVAQGEGALIGLPTIFVRFGGCDFRCSWCDSLYAVLPQHAGEWERLTTDEIVARITNLIPHGAKGHVTYSGGNPAIQKIDSLVNALKDRGVRQAIETQGTVWQDWIRDVNDLTVSPKPPSSGNVTPSGPTSVLHKIMNLSALWFQTRSLKVVVFNDEDYAYAKALHVEFPFVPMILQIGTLVRESTRDDLLDAVCRLQDQIMTDPVMFDTAVLPQMHVVLRGHARGI